MHAMKKVFLIVDNLKVHHATKVTTWVAAHAHEIELFYLPAYAPDHNPDEYLNNDLKQKPRQQPQPASKDELIKNTRAVLRAIQRSPRRIRAYRPPGHHATPPESRGDADDDRAATGPAGHRRWNCPGPGRDVPRSRGDLAVRRPGDDRQDFLDFDEPPGRRAGEEAGDDGGGHPDRSDGGGAARSKRRRRRRGGAADPGDRAGAGGRRSGGTAAQQRHGPPDAARLGAPLQRRGAGRAGEPPLAGSAAALWARSRARAGGAVEAGPTRRSIGWCAGGAST